MPEAPRVSLRAALPCLLVLAAPPVAAAQTAHLSLPQASRPLTLPRSTLRFDAGPRLPLPGGQLELEVGEGDEAVFLNLGLSAGFTSRFEAGVLALPLRLAPDADLTDPLFYLIYALTDAPAAAGVFASVSLPVEGDVSLTGGVPLRLGLGTTGRLDVAGLLRLDVDPTRVTLMFPVELAFDVSPGFFLGPESGIFLPGLDDVTIPLGFFLGPSFTRGARLVGDLRVGARWLDLTSNVERVLVYLRAELFFDV